MFLLLIRFSGPDPHAAIRLIDRLGLFNTIFTDPKTNMDERADTKNWQLAYDPLRELAKADSEGNEKSSHLRTIAKILLRDPEDHYLAWMMSCFVPWARAETPTLNSKSPKTFAAVAAREGIKADNKLTKIINDAVFELESVIKMKDSVVSWRKSTTTPLEIRDRSSIREMQGQAVRHWGSCWRSIAIYALLVQLSEVRGETGKLTINSYNCAAVCTL